MYVYHTCTYIYGLHLKGNAHQGHMRVKTNVIFPISISVVLYKYHFDRNYNIYGLCVPMEFIFKMHSVNS